MGNKAATEVFEALLQTTQVDRSLRRLAQRATKSQGEITTNEWLLLSIIDKGSGTGVALGALSMTLGVSRPQVTALIDNLLVKRYISLKKSKEDKRSKSAFVTERGKDALKSINKAMSETFAATTKSIPQTHMQIYRQVQEELIRKANAASSQKM